MAKYRMVYTQFWEDPRFMDLHWTRKLMMLYLLYGPKSKDSGRYFLNKPLAKAYTGLDGDTIETIIDELGEKGILSCDELTGEVDLTACSDMLHSFAGEWGKCKKHIFERDNYTCTYCSERHDDIVADHILPKSRGGTDTPDNLRTACRRCNTSKGNQTLTEWSGSNAQ